MTTARAWARCSCGHVWFLQRRRSLIDKRCPQCSRELAPEMRQAGKPPGLCQCLRCGHQWLPRAAGDEPARCARCVSPYWNKPRRRAQRPHAA